MNVSALSSSDYENFIESERLSKKNDDPDSTRYLSKYEARKLMQALELKLKLLYLGDKGAESGSRNLKLVTSFAYVLYKLGVNYYETEEIVSSEAVLHDAVQCMSGFETEAAIISVYISVQNYLSCIYSGRSDNDNALKHLLLAKNVYERYKCDKALACPMDPIRCLKYCCNVEGNSSVESDTECDLWIKFEQLYTYTLFYLAQLYKNVDDFEHAALYCHETLVRQLNYGNYEALEWALNSATLSQYYLSNSKFVNFKVARQCLSSALAMLFQKADSASAKTTLSNQSQVEQGKDEKMAETEEKLNQCKADIYRCFAKYGLTLLEMSKDRSSNHFL